MLFFSKECLVTSSGIDNTENGLSGSKTTPKKAWESAHKHSHTCTWRRSAIMLCPLCLFISVSASAITSFVAKRIMIAFYLEHFYRSFTFLIFNILRYEWKEGALCISAYIIFIYAFKYAPHTCSLMHFNLLAHIKPVDYISYIANIYFLQTMLEI